MGSILVRARHLTQGTIMKTALSNSTVGMRTMPKPSPSDNSTAKTSPSNTATGRPAAGNRTSPTATPSATPTPSPAWNASTLRLNNPHIVALHPTNPVFAPCRATFFSLYALSHSNKMCNFVKGIVTSIWKWPINRKYNRREPKNLWKLLSSRYRHSLRLQSEHSSIRSAFRSTSWNFRVFIINGDKHPTETRTF